ncbi:MAG: HAMP domain-containing protein [Alphaproteobacteria bacterium]|nr:HAMP domain-containing protein [Alphaproteobacteria bacterium]
MRLHFWPRTLAAQLVIVTAAALLVSNLAVALWFTRGQQQQTETAVIDRLVDRTISASTLLASIPAKQRTPAADALSSGPWDFKVHRGPAPFADMSPQEHALASRVEGLLPKLKARRAVLVAFRRPTAADYKRRPNTESVIEVMVPLVRGTQLITTFYHPPPPPWPVQSIVGAVVAILMTSLATALVARRVTRPLSKLATAAGEAARGGAAPRVPEEGPSDVRRAAVAFNAMTDQVARTMESQRQLLSAVGHDLRTPITAMRINTEFVEDPDTRERLTKNIEELQELTEAVLSAAKGVGWEEMRKVDLAALVESVCTDLEEMDKPVHWTSHAAAPLSCRPNEIRRAIRNLIENAIAYGKRASVHLNAMPAAYEIIVEDEGPGIPEADQERVLEPFVRLESSRSPETGGSGLGLALVKAIAHGHGGSIRLINRSEGGLRAILCLPRETAAG